MLHRWSVLRVRHLRDCGRALVAFFFEMGARELGFTAFEKKRGGRGLRVTWSVSCGAGGSTEAFAGADSPRETCIG